MNRQVSALCEPQPAAPRPWLGVLAVADMLALVATLATLVVVAIRARYVLVTTPG